MQEDFLGAQQIAEHLSTLPMELGFSAAFFSLAGVRGRSSRLSGRGLRRKVRGVDVRAGKRLEGGFPVCPAAPAHLFWIKRERDSN